MKSTVLRNVILLMCVALGNCGKQQKENSGLGTACPCQKDFKCILNRCVPDVKCENPPTQVQAPKKDCKRASDPNNKKPSPMEKWFTKEIYDDLFPKANLAFGPHDCLPYSYEAFKIAVRYFPKFASETPDNGFTADENRKRDLAAFFSHAVQETGENNGWYFSKYGDVGEECYFRGGMYFWIEGVAPSGLLHPPGKNLGFKVNDSTLCNTAGRYCIKLNNAYPCNEPANSPYFKRCYFGRGPIQLTHWYNYEAFQKWLATQGINVNLLEEPNTIVTKMDPPLAMLGSMWFYMTAQPPKPAMHDIVMGNWNPKPENVQDGYKGAIFGPTSLIINAECGGEHPGNPSLMDGESRRIKAYRWFSKYFGFRLEDEKLLSCKCMRKRFGQPDGPGCGKGNTSGSNGSNGSNGSDGSNESEDTNTPDDDNGSEESGGSNSKCNSAGFAAHETSRCKYYRCVNGNAIEMSCPSTLVWDEQINNCVYPKKGDKKC